MHNPFVHVNCFPKNEEVRKYLSTVPAPDLVVRVEAPLEVALTRTLRRRDKPIRGRRTEQDFADFIQHADDVFQELDEDEYFRNRMIKVVNVDSACVDAVVKKIVNFVLKRWTGKVRST